MWSPDWQADLDDAIDRSGAFLLVLTPNSLRSPNVAIELRRAIGQGKRLKPLLLADVDAGKIDSAIREPQWIDFRDAGAFDARFDDLLTFLDTDVEWVRKHTRFGGLANEWERRGEDRSLLLGRTDLRDAAAWLATQAGKQPPPTPLQVRFVAASAAGARRRKRLVRGTGAAVAVVAGVLGTFALLQTRQANSNARVARSRQIAAAASAQLANDPTASLRLAIRAVTTAPTSQAVAALRQGIAQSYERAVLRGLPTSVGGPTVDEALFSPDGALVAGLTLLAGVRSGTLAQRSHWQPCAPNTQSAGWRSSPAATAWSRSATASSSGTR